MSDTDTEPVGPEPPPTPEPPPEHDPPEPAPLHFGEQIAARELGIEARHTSERHDD